MRRLGGASLALLGIVTLAGIVFLVPHLGEVEAFAAQAARAQSLRLVAGGAAQGETYVCASAVCWLVLVRHGHRLPLLSLALLGLAKLFTDGVIPLGSLSGSILASRALIRRGIPAGDAVTAFVCGTGAFTDAFVLRRSLRSCSSQAITSRRRRSSRQQAGSSSSC